MSDELTPKYSKQRGFMARLGAGGGLRIAALLLLAAPGRLCPSTCYSATCETWTAQGKTCAELEVALKNKKTKKETLHHQESRLQPPLLGNLLAG